MIHIPHCVHRLDLFTHVPNGYEGLLLSFESIEGARIIDISQDPFTAIKQAVMSSLGSPCGLVSSCFCFYTELFCSLYEQLGLIYLEIKNLLIDHAVAFLQKKSLNLGLVSFKKCGPLPIIVIGKGLSLQDDIELLKKCQSRVFIVAAYSALEDLAPHGIVVDLAFASDPLQKKHTATNARALVIAPKANTAIVEGFSQVGFFPETHCSFSNFLLAEMPHPPVYGYTVMDHVLKFLIQSGFESFYLSGIELQETGGFYANEQPCGYKPDFKKAKEHLESLQAEQSRFFSLKELIYDQEFEKPQVIFTPFASSERIELFEKGLEELKHLDFQILGLYEMVNLEKNPFYQVVIEPLYQKWAVTQESQELDKRSFFTKVMHQYQGI